jgi:hypothetical protein
MSIADNWVESAMFGRFGHVLPNPPSSYVSDPELESFNKANSLLSNYNGYSPWYLTTAMGKVGGGSTNTLADYGNTMYNLNYARETCARISERILLLRPESGLLEIP